MVPTVSGGVALFVADLADSIAVVLSVGFFVGAISTSGVGVVVLIGRGAATVSAARSGEHGLIIGKLQRLELFGGILGKNDLFIAEKGVEIIKMEGM